MNNRGNIQSTLTEICDCICDLLEVTLRIAFVMVMIPMSLIILAHVCMGNFTEAAMICLLVPYCLLAYWIIITALLLIAVLILIAFSFVMDIPIDKMWPVAQCEWDSIHRSG